MRWCEGGGGWCGGRCGAGAVPMECLALAEVSGEAQQQQAECQPLQAA